MDETDFRELQAIERSQEWAIVAQLENLMASYDLHMANYHELKEVVGPVEDPELLGRLWAVENRKGLSKVTSEVERRLHNFLASAMSLVAHTRTHIADLYEHSDFQTEYDHEKKKRLSARPVRCFVQDLRNYSQHYRLPIAIARLHFERVGEAENTFEATSSFRLNTSTLLRWDKWKAPSRAFMKASGDEINLAELTDEYMGLIHEFYTWFRDREIEIHEDSVARLEARKARLRAKLNITEA